MASQSPADIVLRALKDAASCCGNDSTDHDACDGVSARLTAETLRCLLKILPDNEESKLLSEYGGDRSRLGPAERFLIELSALPELVYSLSSCVERTVTLAAWRQNVRSLLSA
jgi:hypothetical protein